jgi:high-affinity nickel-transport protein
VLADKLGIQSGRLAAPDSLVLNYVGYVIVALYVVTWLAELAVWRRGRIEEKWTARLDDAG